MSVEYAREGFNAGGSRRRLTPSLIFYLQEGGLPAREAIIDPGPYPHLSGK